MDIRRIRENLGRAKAACLRGETVRALDCALAALKDLGGSVPPSDLRGDLRETVLGLIRDAQIKPFLPAGLSGYTPGQEQALLALFSKIRKQVAEAAEAEDPEAAFERKLKIDRAYNAGLKHLEQKRISEADACFAEAVLSCKDEHRLFYMIANALTDAGEIVRAGAYLKQGLQALPQDPDLAALLERVRAMRQAMKGN